MSIPFSPNFRTFSKIQKTIFGFTTWLSRHRLPRVRT
jgi:hypothetical protein